MTIKLKSAYAAYEPDDGERCLVETFWPEGVDGHALAPYIWAHELAPSYELEEARLWKRWAHAQFLEEYMKELGQPDRKAYFDEIVDKAANGIVTLLHRSKKSEWEIGPEHTTAYDLRGFLQNGKAALPKVPIQVNRSSFRVQIRGQ